MTLATPPSRFSPLHQRIAWLWSAFAVCVGLAMSVLEAEHREIWMRTALFDATVSSALIALYFTPRPQRRLGQSLQVMLKGALLCALAFPVLRQLVWLEVLALAGPLAGLLGTLRQPLPSGFNELDDLERSYAFWLRGSQHNPVLRNLIYEWTLWKHLLVRPRLLQGEHFGTRKGATTGSMIVLLLMGGAVEALLLHTLLARWNYLYSWIWTGLEVMFYLMVLAYGHALRTRPITLTHRRLYLRSGLHWTGSTPRGNIAVARSYDRQTDQGLPTIALGNLPNVTLEFIAPVALYGFYGKVVEVRSVTLQVDDRERFIAVLGE